MGILDTIKGWFRTPPATEADLEREDYEGRKEDAFVSQSFAGGETQQAVEAEFDDH